MGFEKLTPGDLVWCMENEGYDDADYTGYLFMATCMGYVIVCSEYMHHAGWFDYQLAEMAEESEENMGVEVYIFRKKDVCLTEDEAKKRVGIKKSESNFKI